MDEYNNLSGSSGTSDASLDILSEAEALNASAAAPVEAASVETSAEIESSPDQEASQEEESFVSVSGGDASAPSFSEPVQVVLVESPELMEKLDQSYSMLFMIAAILLIIFCRNCLSSWRNKTVKGGS